MDEALAFWWRSAGRPGLMSEALVEPGPRQCLVEAICSSVSPGTERLVAMDQIPESMREEMRCPYMGGHFPFPVKYGYSLVGMVSRGPAPLQGRMVHALHPHQDRCVLGAEDVALIPEGVPAPRATLASNLETAVTALWDAQVTIGERALVVGFGVVGSLVARLLSTIPGVRLVVADVSEGQVALARDMGFEAHHPDNIVSTAAFDLAFHASGASRGLQTAVDLVGFEGRVIELSWYGARPVSLHLGGTFHSQRKSIICSQVSTLPPHQRSRWDMRRRKALVFDLLQNADYDAHLTDTTPFGELPAWFTRTLADPPDGLAQLITYT